MDTKGLVLVNGDWLGAYNFVLEETKNEETGERGRRGRKRKRFARAMERFLALLLMPWG